MIIRFIQILGALSFVLSFGLQPSFASEYMLLLTLRHTFSTDALTLESMSFSQGAASLDSFGLPNAWSTRITSSSGEELGVVPFQPVGQLAGDTISTSGTFVLSVPYIAGTQSIEINTPKNTRALTIPVKSQDEMVATYVTNFARQKEILEKILKEQVRSAPEQQDSPSFPLLPISILGALVVLGAIVFLARRAVVSRTPPQSQ